MQAYIFQTHGWRVGGWKIIFANSQEEAKGLLVKDERKSSIYPRRTTTKAILQDWILAKEESVVVGVIWKTNGAMMGSSLPDTPPPNRPG